jgi:hypothetical protein
MKAIEFKARADKGIIEIPKEIKSKLNQEVRVILLFEENEKNLRQHHFTAAKIKTRGFKFNREEANER